MVQCENRREARVRGRIMSVFAALSAAALLAVAVLTGVTERGAMGSGGHPVLLLREAATQKLAEDGKCDAACKQQANLVKQQMEALRKEINADYHSMTHFGDKAGYVPPPRSIKAQVMDGSLLRSDDGPAAPPPFSPDLSIRVSQKAKKGKAFGTENMKKLLRSQEPRGAHHSPSTSGSSILPPVASVGDMEKKMLRDTPATPSRHSGGDTLSFLHPDRGAAVHVESAHHDHSAGKAKWAKEFNFMQHHDSAAHQHRHGAEKWAKEFSFVKDHAAKAAAHLHITRRAVRGRQDAEPAVVRHAMQKALSFAPHESRTEEAGKKLLGLHQRHTHHASKHTDPLGGKFLAGWFGA